MSGRTDIAKGRVKEAAGVLSGSDKLREKGKADQAVGRIKVAATKVVDKMAERMRK
ncbi:MAG: CsbD family protein [Kiritimatiellae bacterium]|nr:CsbD family protein [Kiritimatiellia bacterium]